MRSVFSILSAHFAAAGLRKVTLRGLGEGGADVVMWARALTLADLAERRTVEVRVGDPVVELTGRPLAVTFGPVPGFGRRATRLDVVATRTRSPLVTRSTPRVACRGTSICRSQGRASATTASPCLSSSVPSGRRTTSSGTSSGGARITPSPSR